MRRIWAGLVLVTLLATGCDRGLHPGNIDKPAPQFVISDGARTVDLNKLRGQVVVVNLWADLLCSVHRRASQSACAAAADAGPGGCGGEHGPGS